MLTTLATILSFNAAYAEEAEPAPAADSTFSERYATPKKTGYDGARHGFRTGYVYAHNAEKSGLLSSPHLFALGYEAEFKVAGGEGIDFIVVPNILFLGLNQGIVLPSGSGMIGLSFRDTLKFGVGANVSPATDGTWVHMVAAVEVVPTSGKLQLPIAVSFIPSETGDFRVGLTVGVNWARKE
ncbi:hypothetical protein LBMAG42_38590 [Deltaproteobacteria bacterium]|nr:hypothetical protein LBMAG42_38590 [Deltaproteobacteria bacterium]